MVMKRYLFINVLCLNFQLQLGQWVASQYPNPALNPELCGRNVKQSWICDPEGVLDKQGADLLEGLVKEIYVGQDQYALPFRCSGSNKGLQIGVAIAKSMSSQTDEKVFAKTLHDSWGVGDEGCDNGVLIFVAIENRKIYISTGKGAVELLPDQIVQNIIDSEIKPYFRQLNYLKGLQSAIVTMGLQVNPDVSTIKFHSRRQKGESIGGWLIPLAIFGWIGHFLWTCYSNRKQSRQYNKAKEALKKLQDDFESAKKQKYISKTCPICFVELEEKKKSTDEKEDKQDENNEERASSSSAPQMIKEDQPLLNETNNNSENRSRKRFYLPCGHCFCEPCVMEWLNNHRTCPICRKPMDRDYQPPNESNRYQPPNSCQGGAATATGVPQGIGQIDYFPEFMFRLRRIQLFYPEFVTGGMVDRWTHTARTQGEFQLQQLRDFQMMDPVVQQQQIQSGSTGSFGGFGGGGGGGGGGAGGGW
eukprot:TRINITY_DN2157_c0_g4_i2.p1 TRINITY_DN2157_c0_g4~~TRINITY_DN2157_c0_g4_i2.p1  ORF type:complete len:475 (+),score=58.38 TRINITY_DN2157_c0_g4_i2:25-1449(+)